MIRLSRVVIVAGAVVTFAACSEAGPTAPRPVPTAAAAEDIFASTVSGSCAVTQDGTNYDVTVAWSGISAIRIELFLSDRTLLAQTVLGHPTRKGSVTDTITVAPDYAEVTDRQTGFKVPCLTGP